MKERRPYPTVSSSDELINLPTSDFVEVAGSGEQIHLNEGDDPVEAARAHMERFPWETRFRVVRLQRFSLDPGAWADDEQDHERLCGATTTLESGVEVRCVLAPHSDGIDHGGRVVRNGRVGVHYWRSSPAPTP